MDKSEIHQRLMSAKAKLFRVALTMLKDEEEAKDIVQDRSDEEQALAFLQHRKA